MQSINFLSALPLELQLQIINKAGLAIPSIAVTSASLRKVVETHPILRYSSTFLSLLKQSYEMTHSKKIEGVVDRPAILQEIALLLATFDRKLAIKIVNSIKNEPYKSSAQKELVQTILKFDKEAAFELAQTIHHYRYQAEALISIVEEFAIHNKTEAFRIADNIKPAEFHAQAYIKIAQIRAIFDVDEAIEVTQSLNLTDKIKAYCGMVRTIGKRNHTSTQRLVEKALKEAFSIQESETRGEALVEIIDILSEEDLQRIPEIKKAALEMPATLTRDLLFLSLVKFLLPLDYNKAAEIFSLMMSPNLKDNARLEIVKKLAMTKIAEAREEASLLTSQENKDLAWREIGFYLIESNIEEAIRLTKSIKSREYKNFLIREIIKKYALNGDIEAAYNIVFSSMEEGSPQQALALSDILKIYARNQPKKVLDFLEEIEISEFKILILLEYAKELMTKDVQFATLLLDSAITATRSLENDLSEKATLFTEIARMISNLKNSEW